MYDVCGIVEKHCRLEEALADSFAGRTLPDHGAGASSSLSMTLQIHKMVFVAFWLALETKESHFEGAFFIANRRNEDTHVSRSLGEVGVLDSIRGMGVLGCGCPPLDTSKSLCLR
jgi:hypothetical protein